MQAQFLHQCDILRSATSLGSTNINLAYIEEQVDRIDNHIHQLLELKNSLRRHANYMRSPLYAIPIEIISRIFYHVVEDSDLYWDQKSRKIKRDWIIGLRQILSLTSVSFHLRQVALKTPELWKQMVLKLDNTKAICCISYAKISSLFHVPATVATVRKPDPITTALSSDIMHNVKVLRLQLSSTHIRIECGPKAGQWWGPGSWKPTFSDFPALTTLDIRIDRRFPKLLLHTLPLSRLEVEAPLLEYISVPTSLKVLYLRSLRGDIAMSILYQCPGLKECTNRSPPDNFCTTTFSRPLTLTHLKRLTWPVELGLMNVDSVENLELPALKSLTVSGGRKAAVEGIIKLCSRVSTTLTDLNLPRYTYESWLRLDASQLFRTPLPRLRTMGFWPPDVPEAIRAFFKSHYSEHLPRLKTLRLGGLRHTDANLVPSEFIDLLKEQKQSGPTYLYLDMQLMEKDWTPELRKELKLIVSDGKVTIRWNGDPIKWLESEDLKPEI